MQKKKWDATLIRGWGVDADPQNEPTYPMRERFDGDNTGMDWQRPEQQPVNVEVLHSNERPNVAAVFGSALPPRGISGAIRRWAFRRSEGNWWHWLALILADRVNVIEGIFCDLARGHIPNLYKEYGLAAAFKYNRKRATSFAMKSAAAVLFLLALRKYKNSR